MIKDYKNQKLQQLLFGVVLFVLYAILMQDFTSSLIIIAILTLIIAMGFNTYLLYDIEIQEDIIIIKTYSLLTKKTQLELSKKDLVDLRYNDAFFTSYNLIINYKEDGEVITKKLYLNAEPWDDLMLKLHELKGITLMR
ncbi:MAG: hypothetical protein ACNS60_13650 [Candidatus Cyclobacteriaceae bacterium M2_1C_046]